MELLKLFSNRVGMKITSTGLSAGRREGEDEKYCLENSKFYKLSDLGLH